MMDSHGGHLDRKYNPRLNLTQEEIAFLVEHPVIRVSNETDWPPFDYVEDGKPAGLSIEYLDELSKVIGVEFKYVNGYTWPELLQMGYDKKIDMLHSLVRTSERAEFLLFTSPYIEFKNAYVTLKTSRRVSSLEDLVGKKLAYPKGYSEYERIKTQFPQIAIVLVKDTEEGLNLVSEGKVDAYLGSTLVIADAAEKLGMGNLQVTERVDSVNDEMDRLRLAIRNDWKPLKSILDKAMPLVPYETRLKLAEKWTRNVPVFYQMNNLSQAEKEWLSIHRTIRAAVVTDVSPIAYFNGQGAFSGIASEYLRAISEETGAEFQLTEVRGFEEAKALLDQGDIDVILPVVFTDQRSRDMLFTQAFYSLPIALYGNEMNPVVKSLDELQGTKLVLVKGSPLAEWMTRDYRGLELEIVENRNMAFERLEKNENLVFAEEYLSGNLVLEQRKSKGVRIVGMTDYQYELSFAMGKDNEVFRDILRKLLPTIRTTKGDIFSQKWLLAGVSQTDPTLRYMSYGLGALIILVLATVAIREQILLRRIRRRFRAVGESLPCAFSRVDGTVIFISRALENIMVEKGLDAKSGLRYVPGKVPGEGHVSLEGMDDPQMGLPCRVVSEDDKNGSKMPEMLLLLL